MKPGIVTQEVFQLYVEKYAHTIGNIKESAHALHASVNQTYDDGHPYGFHLDMVAESVFKYGSYVCANEADVLPMFFGAYFHDSIEDARLTYKDVMKVPRQYMNDEQGYTATEIVFFLTNDKGRTHAKRAGEKYYRDIRETPYAPFVRLGDRLANISYSSTRSNKANIHMKEVYSVELPHFLETINAKSNDKRLILLAPMLEEINDLS